MKKKKILNQINENIAQLNQDYKVWIGWKSWQM